MSHWNGMEWKLELTLRIRRPLCHPVSQQALEEGEEVGPWLLRQVQQQYYEADQSFGHEEI